MYTSLPHDRLKSYIREAVKEAFDFERLCLGMSPDSRLVLSFASPQEKYPSWRESACGTGFTEDDVVSLADHVIDNTYVHNGGLVRRQQQGIPMGTESAPELATLYAYVPERLKVAQLRSQQGNRITHELTFRFIDDILTFDQPEGLPNVAEYGMSYIETTNSDGSCHHNGMVLRIDSGGCLRMGIFDKQTVLNFPMIRYPAANSNIPRNTSMGVFTGGLVRAAILANNKDDFCCAAQSLAENFLRRGHAPAMMINAWHRYMSKYWNSDVLRPDGLRRWFPTMLRRLEAVSPERAAPRRYAGGGRSDTLGVSLAPPCPSSTQGCNDPPVRPASSASVGPSQSVSLPDGDDGGRTTDEEDRVLLGRRAPVGRPNGGRIAMECGLRAVQWVFQHLRLPDIVEAEMDSLARVVRARESSLRYDPQQGRMSEAAYQFNDRPGPQKGFYNVDVILAALHSRTGPLGAGYLLGGELDRLESPHVAYIIGGGGHWRCLLVDRADMTRGEIWDTDAAVMSVVCLPYLRTEMSTGSTLIWVNPEAAAQHLQEQHRMQQLVLLPDPELTELLPQMQGSERTALWCLLPEDRQSALLPLQPEHLRRVFCEAMGRRFSPDPSQALEHIADVSPSPSPQPVQPVADSSAGVQSVLPSSLQLLLGLDEDPVSETEQPHTHSGEGSQSTCVICMDRLASDVARPCGHEFCRSCLRRLMRNRNGAPTCPCCRGRIQSHERADGGPSQPPSPTQASASSSSFTSVDFELRRIREADLPVTGDPAEVIQRMYQELRAEEEAIRAEQAVFADLREARAAVLPTTGNPQDIVNRWALELRVDPPIAMRTRSRAPVAPLTPLPQPARQRQVAVSVDGESPPASLSLFSDSLSSQS